MNAYWRGPASDLPVCSPEIAHLWIESMRRQLAEAKAHPQVETEIRDEGGA